MADTQTPKSPIASARPEMTRSIMDETGLDQVILRTLIHQFYSKVRSDTVLGPIFATHIGDWPSHLERMVSFWSSVALMTGSYHGAAVSAHTHLPITDAHFDRWLALFRSTALEVCPPKAATYLVERAERIARSLHLAVETHGRKKAH